MKLIVCTLIFGEINSMVNFHLKNLTKIQSNKVCIGLSKNSLPSLNAVLKEIHPYPCLHFIEDDIKASEIIKEFGLDITSSYSYSHNQFAVVNLFKWTFLLNILERHKDSEFLLFTDFDVVWFDKVQDQDVKQLKMNFGMSTQLDIVKGKKPVHCTGIILFLNNRSNFNLITEIFQSQIRQIRNGNFEYYDQVAFNNYVGEMKLKPNIGFLPSQNYVIGSDSLKLSFRNRESIKRNLVAYHANYVIGKKSKYLLMYAVYKLKEGLNKYRLIVLAVSLFWKVYFRLQNFKAQISNICH